jgi:phage/conjugal plasmid C-4 type zinc finger TraR family protein
MADEIEMAEDVIAAERDAGIARVKAAMAPSGATECEDCGDDIPDARRVAAPFAVRCACCQSLFERTYRG